MLLLLLRQVARYTKRDNLAATDDAVEIVGHGIAKAVFAKVQPGLQRLLHLLSLPTSSA